MYYEIYIYRKWYIRFFVPKIDKIWDRINLNFVNKPIRLTIEI